MEPEKTTYTKVLLLAGVVIVIAAAAAFFLLGTTSTTKNEILYSEVNTPHDTLIKTNAAFASGEALSRGGKFAEATVEYTKALANAEDSTQEAQIMMKIAHSQRDARKFSEAIATYKQIAANNAYMSIMRAYAIENLGRMYSQYGYAADEIKRETFTGDPYASFAVNADTALAYRRLYEYALSYRGNAGSAARVANWYATEALRLHEADADILAVMENVAFARENLAIADADLERIAADENERSVLPEILFTQGRAIASLSKFGQATLEEAAAKYKESYDFGILGGPGTGGYARYNYAAFLEEYYGDEVNEDIKKILADFNESADAYKNTSVFGLFTSSAAKNNGTNARLRGLAAIDSNFKNTLKSIGWSDDNF